MTLRVPVQGVFCRGNADVYRIQVDLRHRKVDLRHRKVDLRHRKVDLRLGKVYGYIYAPWNRKW